MALSVVGIILSILGISAGTGTAFVPLFVTFGILFTILMAGFVFYNIALHIGESFGLLSMVSDDEYDEYDEYDDD